MPMDGAPNQLKPFVLTQSDSQRWFVVSYRALGRGEGKKEMGRKIGVRNRHISQLRNTCLGSGSLATLTIIILLTTEANTATQLLPPQRTPDEFSCLLLHLLPFLIKDTLNHSCGSIVTSMGLDGSSPKTCKKTFFHHPQFHSDGKDHVHSRCLEIFSVRQKC